MDLLPPPQLTPPSLPNNFGASGESKLFSKRNIITFLIVGVLVLAIPVAISLVQKRTQLQTRASGEASVQFVQNDNLRCDSDGNCTTSSSTIQLDLRAPTGAPSAQP